MVGKSQIKFIKSLQQKKNRLAHQLFVVEGKKTVQELLHSSLETYKVYSTEVDFVQQYQFQAAQIKAEDLKKISTLHTPNGYLGIFRIPKQREITFDDWVLVLDSVNDPGNLGTIIRLCDWFGIKQILCSPDTVDCYNPKVLQATMGSITRVQLSYMDVAEFLKNTQLPIYGGFMNGTPVSKVAFPRKGVLVMGNEANGISEAITGLLQEKITILQYGKKSTESLNVATATAILLHEIRR